MAERLSGTPTGAILSPSSLGESLLSWNFAVDGLPDGLVGEPGRVVRGGRLILTTESPLLQMSVDIDASDVDRLEIAFFQTRPTSVTVEWAAPDETWAPDRRLHGEILSAGVLNREVVRFHLAAHPAWEGPISRLRVTTTWTGTEAQVERVDLLPRALSEVAYDALEDRFFRVDLNSEVRVGQIASLAGPIDLPLDSPSSPSILRFAYGLIRPATSAAQFQVQLASETIWQGSVSPGEEGRWLEAQVRIPEGSAPGKLELRVTPAGGENDDRRRDLLRSAVPVWADLRLDTRRTEDPRPNVVLISLDTFRADRLTIPTSLSPEGHASSQVELTPRLAEWIERSGAAVFENAIAAAPWTLPSHTSLFTGRDALTHGVNHNQAAPDELVTLAESLGAAGYRTVAVTGGGYLHPRYGLAQGFDVFDYWSGEGPEDQEIDEVNYGLERAQRWLETLPEPYFLFFHTYEVHDTLNPRQPYFDRHATVDLPSKVNVVTPQPEVAEGLRKRRAFVVREDGVQQPLPEALESLPAEIYDSRVRYLDERLSTFLEGLEARASNTLVVLTSDHGEMLGEHGEFGHLSLWEENIRVPLVIDLPGPDGGGVIEAQTPSVDLLPTVFDYVGLGSDQSHDGRSLRPLLEGRSDALRDAWTYASASNRGLSYRSSNRRKFVLDNSIWQPIFGRLRHFDPDADSESAVSTDGTPNPLVRQKMIQRYEEKIPGFRLVLQAPAERAIEYELWGSALTTSRLKGANLSFKGARWIATKPPRARVALEPGDSAHLVVEGAAPGSFLEILVVDAEPLRIDLDDLDQHGARILQAGEWRRTEAGIEGPNPKVSAAWRGRQITSSPPEEDAEIRRRLAALGYL